MVTRVITRVITRVATRVVPAVRIGLRVKVRVRVKGPMLRSQMGSLSCILARWCERRTLDGCQMDMAPGCADGCGR